MTQCQLTSFLSDIIKTEPNTIRAIVAQQALEAKDPNDLFGNFDESGCVMSDESFVWNVDCRELFDQHYDEIMILFRNTSNWRGDELWDDPCDIKEFFAWFAFEETAELMLEEFETKEAT